MASANARSSSCALSTKRRSSSTASCRNISFPTGHAQGSSPCAPTQGVPGLPKGLPQRRLPRKGSLEGPPRLLPPAKGLPDLLDQTVRLPGHLTGGVVGEELQ